MNKEQILVVGASGTVGTELTIILKQKGHNVISTTSQKAKANNKDVLHMDLVTGEGINGAFANIDKAFFLSPPGYADQYALLSPLIQEAKRKGLKKVVLMTAMGANANPESPFRKAEIELEKSGLTYNIIRPNWFLQNFNTFWLQDIKQQKKILLPAGKAKVSFIDAHDIAAVAAKLLTSDEFNNKDFDLTGPEAVDHQQVAEAISSAINTKIAYEEISSETFKNTFVERGVPKDYVDFLALIFGFLKEGYSAGLTKNVEMLTGKAPQNLHKYVNTYKGSFYA